MKKQLLLFILMLGKFSVYLFIIKGALFSSLMASEARAQFKSVHEVEIRAVLSEASVKDVLQQIEKQTDYKFQYYSRDIATDDTFTFNYSKISVGELLYEISASSGL
ncbi:MAG: hypothetical protein AAFO69_13005, partial [Bacteroidota bacterium]